MIPKEIAKKLFLKIYKTGIDQYQAKKCALITVDEMIEESIIHLSVYRNKYWKEIKKEIEKL
jgi:hypothetical protein